MNDNIELINQSENINDSNNEPDNDFIFVIGIIIIWFFFYVLYKKYNIFNKKNNNKIINTNNVNNTNNIIKNIPKMNDISYKKIKKINKNKSFIQIFKNICLTEYREDNALKVYRDTTWTYITYKQYWDNCIRFATALDKNILINNRKVGIIGFNCPAWFYCYLGTMMSSGIPVGIDVQSSSDVIEYILNQCSISVLLIEGIIQLEKIKNIKHNLQLIIMYNKPSQTDILMAEKCGCIIISFVEFMNNVNKEEIKEFIPNLCTDLSSIATILYTSGNSNNYPKGVEVSHSMIINALSSIVNQFNDNTLNLYMGSERFISYLPLNNFMSQIIELYLPILSAGTVWFADKNALIKKSSLLNTLITVKPTIFAGMSSTWNNINVPLSPIITTITPSNILLKKIGLNKCKLCINLHTMLTNDIHNKFKNMGIIIYDWYGLTETFIISLSLPNQYKEESVGKIIEGIKIKLAPDNEILIKGKSIFKSYNSNDIIDINDKDGWFKTGDFGKIDKDGFLYITGKKQEFIVLKNGQQISPNKIEDNLKEELTYNNIDINHVVLIGNNRPFLSVMLDLKNDVLKKYQKNKSNMNKKINKCIDTINKISQYKINKFIICPNNFEIGKEITASSNGIRRSYIEKTYRKLIDNLYKK
jgi:long-subunit acyl-CoA synthetase (AMP-forming)